MHATGHPRVLATYRQTKTLCEVLCGAFPCCPACTCMQRYSAAWPYTHNSCGRALRPAAAVAAAPAQHWRRWGIGWWVCQLPAPYPGHPQGCLDTLPGSHSNHVHTEDTHAHISIITHTSPSPVSSPCCALGLPPTACLFFLWRLHCIAELSA